MQEDILGTMRTVMPSTIFITCSRCGKQTPRSLARIVDATLLDDNHSEFAYICRDCDAAIKAGEDLPPEP